MHIKVFFTFSNLHSLILLYHNVSFSVLANLLIHGLIVCMNKTLWSTQTKGCVLYVIMETSQAIYGNPICFISHKSVVHHIIPQSFLLNALKLGPQILDSHRSLLCIYETALLLHLHQTFFSSQNSSSLKKPLCLFPLQVLNVLF